MPPTWFERHPRITIAGVVIIGFLILDICAANLYKWVTGYPWSKSYQAVEHTYRIRSLIYHHDLAKLKSVDNAPWGPVQYHVRTNSLGFKDKEVRQIPLESNRHRLLFMGDSFVEGVGLDYQNTFVGIIDSALSQKGIEVLNAGVCGYSPIIYYRKTKYLLEDVGLKFDDLIVVPDISDALDETIRTLDDSGNVHEFSIATLPLGDGTGKLVQDIPREDFLLIPQGPLKKLKEWLRNNTIVTFAVSKWLHGVEFALSGQKGYAINQKSTYWTLDQKLYQEFGRQGLQRIQTYMNKLYDLIQEHHIRMWIVIFPNPDQVYYDDRNSIWVTFWQDWCQLHDVRLLNCYPFFVKGQTPAEREQLLNQYFIRGDVHFTELGNHLMAKAFLDFYIFPPTE
jgi:hypothetical protein